MKLLSVVCASATSLSGSAGETACVAHPDSAVAARTPSALRREGLSIIVDVIIVVPSSVLRWLTTRLCALRAMEARISLPGREMRRR
jgi:hypothetical protein